MHVRWASALLHVCVRACVRANVRPCVCVCVRACVRACVRERVRMCVINQRSVAAVTTNLLVSLCCGAQRRYICACVWNISMIPSSGEGWLGLSRRCCDETTARIVSTISQSSANSLRLMQ